MRFSRLLYSLYVGLLVSFFLFFVFGQAGLRSYRSLASHKAHLAENIGKLKRINGELVTEQQALVSRPERIKILARGIGLFEPDEYVIVVDDAFTTSSVYEVGTLIGYTQPKRGSRTLFNLLSAASALLFYMISGMVLKAGRRGHKPRRY
jgi:cell division protein FtsB